jgi:hypothetical protein
VVSPEYTCYFDGGGGSGGGYYGGDDYYDYAPSRGCSPGCGKNEYSTGGVGGGYYGGNGGAGGGGGGGELTMVPEVPPVSVVHQATVGPYETVTLHANVPNVLTTWLTDHGYAIDPAVQPIVDAYTAEGFDFIAMRLQPGQGVDRMKPVRVLMPGASPTLPLRMVSAGTGANVALTLFVVGEGRYESANFPNGEVSASSVTWDFDAQESDYAKLRLGVLAANGGRTWNTAYAEPGGLLSIFGDPVTGDIESYVVGGTTYDTIAAAYVHQGVLNGEGATPECTQWFPSFATASSKVVAACDDVMNGGTGGQGTGGQGTGGAPSVTACGPDELDGRKLACGMLDDLAVAFEGMHPKDVWLTRLEANLPHAALDEDLTLDPAPGQQVVSKWILTTQSTGDPCANLSPLSAKVRHRRPAHAVGARGAGKAMIAPGRTPRLVLALAVAALAITLGRRRGRTGVAPRPPAGPR